MRGQIAWWNELDDKRKERRGKEKRCGNKIKTEILLPLIYISKSSSEAKKNGEGFTYWEGGGGGEVRKDIYSNEGC